jgi:hypothetical protein
MLELANRIRRSVVPLRFQGQFRNNLALSWVHTNQKKKHFADINRYLYFLTLPTFINMKISLDRDGRSVIVAQSPESRPNFTRATRGCGLARPKANTMTTPSSRAPP